MSTHGLSLADELELAERLGICPKEVYLVAAVAGSAELGRAAAPKCCGSADRRRSNRRLDEELLEPA